MKAKRIDGQAVNGNKTKLSEVLPLNTPYSITFFPIYACNFKCNYCLHSLDSSQRDVILDEGVMSLKLFKKCIDDLALFPQKVKAIHFAGLGEPLLHPDIVQMIEYVVEKNVSENIDILTNGTLLTKDLSEKLINSGINKLRISIQGISCEKYKEISGVDVEFDKFIGNIKWFYENKKETKLYIKIIDIGLSEYEKEKFFELFGNICDEIAIEHLCPFVDKLDYDDISKDSEFILTMNGNQVPTVEVCPQPFYSFQIYPDGNYVPCCTVERPISLGNCKIESIFDIWNGKKLNEFRKMHLKKQKKNNKVCSQCQQYKYSMFLEEVLDNDADRLIKLFE